MKKIKFNKDVKLFNLNNIKCFANFQNGSFIGIDEKGECLINYIKSNNSLPNNLDEEDINMLNALDEAGYFQKNNPSLKSCYLHVTNRCNLNCTGCYSFDLTRNTIDDLSLNELKKIMDQLKQEGIEYLTISGGEPLIRNDIVDIVKYAKETCKFKNINLITNGTVKNKDILIGIKEYINDIAVSIDGYDYDNPTFIRDTGIFPKVIETIKIIKEIGLNVAILPTLHRKNIDNMEKYLDLANKLKVKISFSIMTCSKCLNEFIPTEDQLIRLSRFIDGTSDYFNINKQSIQDYNIIARKNCGAGTSNISIAANGDIYPCHMLHDSRVKLGNIRENSLENVLKNKKIIPDVDKIEKCNECKYKYICGGCCRARAFLVNENLNTADPYCAMYNNFYKQFIKELENSI